jgi:hypothetical protein
MEKNQYPAKNRIEPAVAILRGAEAKLRDAAAKAAAEGEYDTVVEITKWAKTLRAFILEATSTDSDAQSAPTSSTDGTVSEPAVVKTAQPDQSRLRSGSATDVPRFGRDADYLIKQAYSQKTHSEYEHRAPAEVLFGITECLAEWRSTRRLLTSEQLIESYVKQKGKPVTYQLYVALGWLIQLGLVHRHGRRGYSVPSPGTIVHEVKTAWARL